MVHDDSDPRSHPAALAWRSLHPEFEAPCSIFVLKPDHRKSAVYRLEGAGPGQSSVIAKRCQPGSARVERTIYETVLPNLPVSSLHYYGCLERPGEGIWLFVEDAGEVWYSDEEVEHRELAALWLGTVHGTATKLDAIQTLPDRGPDYYLDVLTAAWSGITGNLDNPALAADDCALLIAIVAQCDTIAARWKEIESFCAQVPRTLVHGDFVGKNVRVRPSPNGPVLLPFDWESAGYGVPAADLESIDVSLYHPILEAFWPSLAYDTTLRLAQVGRLFRLIHFVKWASDGLAYPWVAKTMNNYMPYYHAWIQEALQKAGWSTETL